MCTSIFLCAWGGLAYAQGITDRTYKWQCLYVYQINTIDLQKVGQKSLHPWLCLWNSPMVLEPFIKSRFYFHNLKKYILNKVGMWKNKTAAPHFLWPGYFENLANILQKSFQQRSCLLVQMKINYLLSIFQGLSIQASDCEKTGAVGVVRIPVSQHSFHDCACQLHSVSGMASGLGCNPRRGNWSAHGEIPSHSAYFLLGFCALSCPWLGQSTA